MEGLTEGRMVHYVKGNPTGHHKAAVVTFVANQAQGIVDLHVFQQDSSFPVGLYRGIKYSETPVPDTWHWIEKA